MCVKPCSDWNIPHPSVLFLAGLFKGVFGPVYTSLSQVGSPEADPEKRILQTVIYFIRMCPLVEDWEVWLGRARGQQVRVQWAFKAKAYEGEHSLESSPADCREAVFYDLHLSFMHGRGLMSSGGLNLGLNSWRADGQKRTQVLASGSECALGAGVNETGEGIWGHASGLLTAFAASAHRWHMKERSWVSAVEEVDVVIQLSWHFMALVP